MAIVDEYLKRAYQALDKDNPNEIDALAREIVSAFQNDISGITHYRGGRVAFVGSSTASSPDLHSVSDLMKLIGKLRVLRENKDNEVYGAFGFAAMTASIRELEDCMYHGTTGEDLIKVYRRIDDTYANEYRSYTDGLSGWDNRKYEPSVEETEKRISKLRNFRDKEMRKIRIAEAEGGTVNVNQSAIAQASAEAYCTITLSQALENVDGLPSDKLSDEDKTYLKGLLAELSQTIGVDRKDGEKKYKKILTWIADKGIDVAIAAAPYVMQTIQTLV